MSEKSSIQYPTTGYAWYTVFLLLVVYTFSFIDRQILALLGPMIIDDFQLSDTEFGVLSGFAFAIFYTIFGLYFARIADNKSRKLLIAAGLVIWSVMTAASAFARSHTTLFLMRIGVGIGEATLSPAAGSIIADSFPKDKLATALSIYAMGIPFGIGFSYLLGGQMITVASSIPDIQFLDFTIDKIWQKTFLLVGLPGLLITILVLFLKEPTRKGTSATHVAMPFSEVYEIFKQRWKAYISISLGTSFIAALGFGTAAFLPAFFLRIHDVAPSEMGQTFGIIAMVTGPLGLLLGGIAADLGAKKGHRDAHLKALMLAPLGFAIPSTILPFLEYSSTLWIMVGISNLFLNLPAGVAFASLQLISPNRMRGQIIAFHIFLTSIIGYGLGPTMIGYFADTFFTGPESIGYGAAVVAAIAFPASLILYQWGRKPFKKALIEEEKRIAERLAVSSDAS
ncbi:MFS transporter [Kordiimonas sp. SCSIO 12610]|uniref:spinster family MFS transporter n=1 Tax=Kordiimonas sp. SCSIO 12610 TaxID=2829597 RepID=UPI00210AB844|nr:MFS transporter [Kordiimonas sp. SCSIO 12610]UTW55243.1 MFS transporter [Kordiimonas sp. SCSIO 12610]